MGGRSAFPSDAGEKKSGKIRGHNTNFRITGFSRGKFASILNSEIGIVSPNLCGRHLSPGGGNVNTLGPKNSEISHLLTCY
jgi:hypothetical protein